MSSWKETRNLFDDYYYKRFSIRFPMVIVEIISILHTRANQKLLCPKLIIFYIRSILNREIILAQKYLIGSH
jgi:hypothetical protein